MKPRKKRQLDSEEPRLIVREYKVEKASQVQIATMFRISKGLVRAILTSAKRDPNFLDAFEHKRKATRDKVASIVQEANKFISEG